MICSFGESAISVASLPREKGIIRERGKREKFKKAAESRAKRCGRTDPQKCVRPCTQWKEKRQIDINLLENEGGRRWEKKKEDRRRREKGVADSKVEKSDPKTCAVVTNTMGIGRNVT